MSKSVATLDVKRSPLAAMSDRLSIDPAELEQVLMKTVMPNPNVDREKVVAFLSVANAYGLDPLKKEIYAFPAKGGAIQPIVSIDGWLSIINSHPKFDGMELVENHDEHGALVSVTCRIFRSDRSQPTVVTEYLEECRQRTEPWNQRPRRMLRHKAAIQCARYAFGLGGIMEEDEARDAFGERDVTPSAPAAPRPQPLAPYPEDDFRANLPKWQKLIEGGRKTPDEIIATVRTKAPLSPEQEEEIRNLAPIEVPADQVADAAEETHA
jgi:phage recombination protein Bet